MNERPARPSKAPCPNRAGGSELCVGAQAAGPVDPTKIIEAEADRYARHVRGAVERDDLLGAGWLAFLTARAGMALPALRLRIRGAIADTMRREWRAQGRVDRAIFWPVYWPKTFHRPGIPDARGYRRPHRLRRCAECHAEIERGKRCPPCAKQRRLEKQRLYNWAYYHGEVAA